MDITPPTSSNPWGRYQSLVADEVRSCEEYVARLRDCVTERTTPSRRAVIEQAYHLHLVANQLVRVTQDVERWLGACAAPIEPSRPRQDYTTTCTLPAGHTGSHDDHPPITPGELVREESRHIAEQTDRLTNRLAWLTNDIDRQAAGNRQPDPDHRKLLHELTTKLNAISYDVGRLANEATDLAPEPQRDLVPDRATGVDRPTTPPAPHRGLDR